MWKQAIILLEKPVQSCALEAGLVEPVAFAAIKGSSITRPRDVIHLYVEKLEPKFLAPQFQTQHQQLESEYLLLAKEGAKEIKA